LIELARALHRHRVTLLASGGTARAIREAGLEVLEVSKVTGAPEILGGRVKTLHPRIYGGILARRDDPEHLKELKLHEIELIDLVCVNFYPFEKTVASGAWLGEALENIDIGGPCMVRAAAKNFPDVAVLTDPGDYAALIEEMNTNDGEVGPSTRERLAAKAFRLVAGYNDAIAVYLAGRSGASSS
jgi:phosphoribosylaminoimidazolecarboxamide formyltransferase/IMP cyclohydrolase